MNLYSLRENSTTLGSVYNELGYDYKVNKHQAWAQRSRYIQGPRYTTEISKRLIRLTRFRQDSIPSGLLFRQKSLITEPCEHTLYTPCEIFMDGRPILSSKEIIVRLEVEMLLKRFKQAFVKLIYS